jgi:hypothetical protein
MPDDIAVVPLSAVVPSPTRCSSRRWTHRALAAAGKNGEIINLAW